MNERLTKNGKKIGKPLGSGLSDDPKVFSCVARLTVSEGLRIRQVADSRNITVTALIRERIADLIEDNSDVQC